MTRHHVPEKVYEECEKLSKRTEDWNSIYPFMEWLREQRWFLCRCDTQEDAKARGETQFKDGSYWQYPDPIPIGKNIDDLLYEYFEVDTIKLEQERRELLKKLGEKTATRSKT